MRKILLVARRDYIASVMTRGFLLGLVIAPLLFGGGFIVLALIRGSPDISDKRVAQGTPPRPAELLRWALRG